MARSKIEKSANNPTENRSKFSMTPEAYSSMLSGIRPVEVALVKFRGIRKPTVLAPVSGKSPLNVSIDDVVVESNLGNDAKVFEIRAEMGVSIKYETRVISDMSATFSVTYTSEITVNEEFIKIYKGTSFPLIVNPYFREFIQSTMTRMGIRNVILPLFITAYPKARE